VKLHRFRAADGTRRETLAHPLEHRKDEGQARVEHRDAEVRDLAVHGPVVAALTRWGVWLFREDAAIAIRETARQ